MTKRTFVSTLATNWGTSIQKAGRMLDVFLDSLKAALESEERLLLPGFAVLRIRTRRRRLIVNPKTGRAMYLPETREVRLYAAGRWKRALNGRRE